MNRQLFCVALFSIASVAANALAEAASVGQQSQHNQLTESEARSGWQLLFDGKSTDGWRNYQKEDVSDGWQVNDGELVRVGKGAGDIVTKDKYKFFELSLEYKISKGGNSGLMFHVTEDEKRPWQTGPEIQIQDNVDGHDPQKSGWMYQLHKPTSAKWVKNALKEKGIEESGTLDTTRPAGEWNELFLRLTPNRSEVCMNGVVYYRFKKGSDDWKKRVSESKFSKFANFGKADTGHLCLQDHGNEVAFRNIKVRKVGQDGDRNEVTNPVHGSIAVVGKPAFPNLEWEGWESETESGKQQKLRTIVLTSGSDGYLYTASQTGMIHRFKNDPEAAKAELILDLRERVKPYKDRGANEEGLLGLALHPEFAENGRMYVYYTIKGGDERLSSVSEFTKTPTETKFDMGTERVVMRIEQPFQNHNGGSLEFGHDGYLYVGMGDGGLMNDPFKHGQDLSKRMGKILRIDVNSREGDLGYGIPSDNPFVEREGALPEIYAYGLRNVWRLSFDQATGDLWAADVGQDLWEEVNLIKKGGNYGWSVREGTHAFNNTPSTSPDPLIDPIWEYDHQIGKSITGGHVCRSNRIPELNGKYIYADYVSGRIWALAHDPSGNKPTQNFGLIDGGMPVLAFGQDTNGEVYYLIESPTGETIHRFEKK